MPVENTETPSLVRLVNGDGATAVLVGLWNPDS
jgi:hypothetical protein